MIIIDFLEPFELTQKKTVMQPRLCAAKSFRMMPIEHMDNKDNEELSEFNRYEVTRITYVIEAIVVIHSSTVDIPVKEYDTEAEALEEYKGIVKAVSDGANVYVFSREEAANEHTGDSEED